MSKLSVDQKTITQFFQDKHADFLIPDYQRPYDWGPDECNELWSDLVNFAIPDDDPFKFDKNSEYFLGPLTLFKNENGKQEIIDGQQRLTTLMLLLRCFYKSFGKMEDEKVKSTKKNIARCIWKTDEFEEPDFSLLKIDSEVASDEDKEEFLDILKSGEVDKKSKSKYAQNYRLLENQITQFRDEYPEYLSYLAIRILNNCILLPIEADSQDTALTIFSTLNDRGKPLSDADIFKAQLYKFYSSINKRDLFVEQWKDVEERSKKLFKNSSAPMDELFTRYMYYIRAKKGNKDTTTESLRRFYQKDDFALLKQESTFSDMQGLLKFWEDINYQNNDRFSDDVLKRLFVLNYAPNGMWTYLLSVYFMHHKDKNGNLEDKTLLPFLNRMIAFIWTYAVVKPGVNSLRTPVYAEMVNIVNDKEENFKNFAFDVKDVKTHFEVFGFSNMRSITRSMLAWWLMERPDQELLSLETAFDIEHIYPRARNEKEKSLIDSRNIESLGNKSLLERKINISASDYRFDDKKKYYLGYQPSKGSKKAGTKIQDLIQLAKNKNDFSEKDIMTRNSEILSSWLEYLHKNELLKSE